MFRLVYMQYTTTLYLADVMQVALSILRVLLFVARPKTIVLGNIPDSKSYRSVDQYPTAQSVPGLLILEIGAPIYFTNAGYLRERCISIDLYWRIAIYNLILIDGVSGLQNC